MKLKSYRRIKNGGFEQGILQVMADEKLASEKDIERLAYLKSLPQDKVEVTAEHEIKENTDESK